MTPQPNQLNASDAFDQDQQDQSGNQQRRPLHSAAMKLTNGFGDGDENQTGRANNDDTSGADDGTFRSRAMGRRSMLMRGAGVTGTSRRAPPPPRVGPAQSIQLLVCSANMGNAQPDLDSLNAWIPPDGLTRYVVTDTVQYPIGGDADAKESPTPTQTQTAQAQSAQSTPAAPLQTTMQRESALPHAPTSSTSPSTASSIRQSRLGTPTNSTRAGAPASSAGDSPTKKHKHGAMHTLFDCITSPLHNHGLSARTERLDEVREESWNTDQLSDHSQQDGKQLGQHMLSDAPHQPLHSQQMLSHASLNQQAVGQHAPDAMYNQHPFRTSRIEDTTMPLSHGPAIPSRRPMANPTVSNLTDSGWSVGKRTSSIDAMLNMSDFCGPSYSEGTPPNASQHTARELSDDVRSHKYEIDGGRDLMDYYGSHRDHDYARDDVVHHKMEHVRAEEKPKATTEMTPAAKTMSPRKAPAPSQQQMQQPTPTTSAAPALSAAIEEQQEDSENPTYPSDEFKARSARALSQEESQEKPRSLSNFMTDQHKQKQLEARSGRQTGGTANSMDDTINESDKWTVDGLDASTMDSGTQSLERTTDHSVDSFENDGYLPALTLARTPPLKLSTLQQHNNQHQFSKGPADIALTSTANSSESQQSPSHGMMRGTNIPVTSSQHQHFDLLVIGMQESTFEVDDDDYIQLPASARSAGLNKKMANLTANKDYVVKDRSERSTKSSNTSSTKKSKRYDRDNENDWADTIILHKQLDEHLPSYRKVVSFQRGEMRLEVFVLKNSTTLKTVEVLGVKAHNTGRAGLANKGGIVAELCLNQSTRIALATCHLEAHEGRSKYKARCSSIQNILRETHSAATACRTDVSIASHYTFWMGDLNFRTDFTKRKQADVAKKRSVMEPGSKPHINWAHQLAETRNYNALNDADELAYALREKDCLVGFNTPPCHFPPTFKVTKDKPGYVYNEKRSPSYTDRILYKTAHQMEGNLKCLVYEPIDDYIASDHKPIRGAFTIQLNHRLKWRPTLLNQPSRQVFSFKKSKKSKKKDGSKKSSKLKLKSKLLKKGKKDKKDKKAKKKQSKKKGSLGISDSDDDDDSSEGGDSTPKLKTKKGGGFPSQAMTMGSIMRRRTTLSTESMHIFVSDISVKIDHTEYKPDSGRAFDVDPSPFVCFVSTPTEACQNKISKWELFQKKFRITTMGTKKEQEDGSVSRTMLGWPRTKKISNCYAAEWKDDEEVHFTVKTHLESGMPIDLSGAMLHLVVMDAKYSKSRLRGEPRLVGTFALNLANLVSKTSGVGADASGGDSITTGASMGQGLAPPVRTRSRSDGAAGETFRKMPQRMNPSANRYQSPSKPFMVGGRQSNVSTLGFGESFQASTTTFNQNQIGRNDSNLSLDGTYQSGQITVGPSDRLRETLNASIFSCQARKQAGASLLESLRRQAESERSAMENGAQSVRRSRRIMGGDGLGRLSWHDRTARRRNSNPTEAPKEASPRMNMRRKRHNEPGRRSLSRRPSIGSVSGTPSTNGPGSSVGDSGDVHSVGGNRESRMDVASTMRPMLWRGLMGRSSRRHISEQLDTLNIHSIRIEEPLLKYGKQMGTITCTIDAWWQADDGGSGGQGQGNGGTAGPGMLDRHASLGPGTLFGNSSSKNDVGPGNLDKSKSTKSKRRGMFSSQRLKPKRHESAL